MCCYKRPLARQTAGSRCAIMEVILLTGSDPVNSLLLWKNHSHDTLCLVFLVETG